MKNLLKRFTKRNITLICIGGLFLFIADMFFSMNQIAWMLLFVVLGFACLIFVAKQK